MSMLQNIIIVHYDSKCLKPFQKKGFRTICCFIDEVKNTFLNDTLYYVSPANSNLSLNGGVDKAYHKMFPGLEEFIMKKAPIEVGKSLLTKITDSTYFISSPTMESPMELEKDTKNVYKAMLSTMNIFNKQKNNSLLILTPFGTGVDKLSYEYSAEEMFRAIKDSKNS